MAEDALQVADAADVFAEDDPRLHPAGLAGDARGDVRVAVAVAADPGAELDEARQLPRRVRVGFSPGALQVAVQQRDRLEQGFLKIMQAVLDLGLHGRLAWADFVGLPQQLDFREQAFDSFVAFYLGQVAVIGGLQKDEDSPQRLLQDATLRLGRVGGEDRHVIRLQQQLLGLGGAEALFLEHAQGRVERTRPQRGAGMQVAVPPVLQRRLLGDVDQAEVGGERPDDLAGEILVHSVDQAHQAGAPLQVLLALQADVAPAQALHGLEHLGGGMLLEHAAEQATQQLDSLPELAVSGVAYRRRVSGRARHGKGGKWSVEHYTRRTRTQTFQHA